MLADNIFIPEEIRVLTAFYKDYPRTEFSMTKNERVIEEAARKVSRPSAHNLYILHVVFSYTTLEIALAVGYKCRESVKRRIDEYRLKVGTNLDNEQSLKVARPHNRGESHVIN